MDKKPDLFNTQFLNEVAKKLCDALPQGVHTFKNNVEKNFHVILKSAFNKLDLVTREEFDAQSKVLQRSRQRLELLEKKINELEALIEAKK